MRLILIILIVSISTIARAQLEHNFEVEPSNTNCHELPEMFTSQSQAINSIENATFRTRQTIKISRYQSPRSAVFYSCDGKTGYMIVDINDKLREVYSNVPQEVWSQFINTNDPIGFYSANVKDKFKNIE